MNETEIYSMGLHEKIVIEEKIDYTEMVRRVPGGWNYSYFFGDGAYKSVCSHSVFVPYNDEFKPVVKDG